MTKNFLSKAKSWAAKNKILGPQAFLKYVIFTYLNELNKISEEFVLKGGNLLWVYIQSPRATVDLDLSTLEEDDDERIKAILASVSRSDGISFKLENFQSFVQKEKRGAAATVSYKTDSGAVNKFGIDIAYATPIDIFEIDSPIGADGEIKSASIENIIADKLSAVQRFKSGNTRMKDFDDLWRISKSEIPVDFKKLNAILAERGISKTLDRGWVSDHMKAAWKSHRKNYRDLPEDLLSLFKAFEQWLTRNT